MGNATSVDLSALLYRCFEEDATVSGTATPVLCAYSFVGATPELIHTLPWRDSVWNYTIQNLSLWNSRTFSAQHAAFIVLSHLPAKCQRVPFILLRYRNSRIIP